MTETRAEYNAIPDEMPYRLVMRSHDLRLTLDYIIHFKSKHGGDSPSYREIANGLGIASTNTVAVRLKRLQEAGKVKLGGCGQSRRIEVVGGEWRMKEDFSEIPT